MYSHPKLTSALAAAFLFTSTAVSALPLHVKRDHKYEDKVYAYSQVWLDESGKGKLYSHYSNCSRDGDTLSTIAVLIGRDGQKLGAVEIRAGMSPELLSGCNEREIDKHFRMSPEQARQVASIRLVHRPIDTVNDGMVFTAVIEVIKAILQGPTEEEAGVHWRS